MGRDSGMERVPQLNKSMIVGSSLRWQLQRYYFIILLLTLGTLTALAIHRMRENELYKFDSKMRDHQKMLVPLVSRSGVGSEEIFGKVPDGVQGRRVSGSGPGPRGGGRGPGRRSRPDPPAADIEKRNGNLKELMAGGLSFSAWSKENGLLASSKNYPEEITPDEYPGEGETSIVKFSRGYRQMITKTPHIDSLIIMYPEEVIEASMSEQTWPIAWVNLGILLLATFFGWILIGRALGPIKVIQQTADDIAKGHLDRRIELAGQTNNKIGELSGNLNQTFDQLEAMFERQIRFTSDASHELRTPIAVILNHCQHGLSKERTGEEYRAALMACNRAGERMKSLTSDLLELSKLEKGEVGLVLAACSMGEVAEEALELVEPLSAGKGVVLKSEIRDFSIKANADRIWQVMVNLLNNAIRHTPSGKSVTLKTECDDREARISVIDEGEGIPEESIPHLFDRFYRADSSRQRTQEKGGFGLGLAICDTIVKAHQGSIKVESTPGVETRFVMILPL